MTSAPPVWDWPGWNKSAQVAPASISPPAASVAPQPQGLLAAIDPRPWLSQPGNAEPYVNTGAIALPAIGNTAQAGVVLQFTVPPNRNGVITKIANAFVGGGWTDGTGDIVWQIFRDQALTEAIKGFGHIVSSLGAVANMQSIPPIRIYENQVITLVINNVAVVPSNQIITGGFIGYFYPKSQEWEGAGV